MLRSLVILLCVVVAADLGCGKKRPTASTSPSQSSSSSIDERRAVAIAKLAVGEHETWGDRATYDAKRQGDGWAVNVWRGSRTPGGRRTVMIDKDGNVTDYIKID